MDGIVSFDLDFKIQFSNRLFHLYTTQSGVMQLRSSCEPRAMLSLKYYAPNWFNCLIVCSFGAEEGKYYSKKRGKSMQL